MPVGNLRLLRLLAVLVVPVLIAAGCADDDDTAVDTGDTTDGDNVLAVDMFDYGYGVSGSVTEGHITINSENTGDEWHMMAVGKLREGVSIDAFNAALQGLFSGGPGGPPEDGTDDTTDVTGPGGTTDDTTDDTTDVTGTGGGTDGTTDGTTDDTTDVTGTGGGTDDTTYGRAAAQDDTDDTTDVTDGVGDDEGPPDDEDPLAQFIERELGAPGHVLQPGTSQSLTVDNLDAGNYVMLCFIPTEGEGVPHIAKGMVADFTVESGDEGEAPAVDETYALEDNQAPEGPAELEAGTHTFQVTASGAASNDFFMGRMDEGEEFEAWDRYFGELFESPEGPPVGAANQAPGRIDASVFEIEPGQSVWFTIDLEPGEYLFVNTTNVEEGEPADQVLQVTVT